MASNIDGSRRHQSVIVFSLLLVVAGFGDPLEGQEDLDVVNELISAGRTEEARAILESWWEDYHALADRGDRQQALWLRAVLTVDPLIAGLDYQRLVLTYPSSPYSDEALQRLGLISAAEGDLAEAVDYFRALVRDYPGSPKRGIALAWLSENEMETEAGKVSLTGTEAVGGQRKSALFQTGELGVSLPSEVAILESPDAPALQRAESELLRVESRYAVQLGAFLLEERAERLMEIGEDAGFVTRLVRVKESDLIRVRIGNFTGRTEAVQLMEKIHELGYDATVVRDVTLEEPFR